MERIALLGDDYIKVLIKVAKGEILDLKDRIKAVKLMRMGVLKPKNATYSVVDPLFRRLILAFEASESPSDVVVVGHWAERIVGNYLLRKGYVPFYSHDSRGAFDIYVRIGDFDVGIQVKYSSEGEVRLSKEDALRILGSAREMNWIPILALVSRGIRFFWRIKEGVYRESDGVDDIEEAVRLGLQSS